MVELSKRRSNSRRIAGAQLGTTLWTSELKNYQQFFIPHICVYITYVIVVVAVENVSRIIRNAAELTDQVCSGFINPIVIETACIGMSSENLLRCNYTSYSFKFRKMIWTAPVWFAFDVIFIIH